MQVYRGRLRSTGEEVAVKVQRPDISENIAIDMLLLRRFMKLVDAQLPNLIDVSSSITLPRSLPASHQLKHLHAIHVGSL